MEPIQGSASSKNGVVRPQFNAATELNARGSNDLDGVVQQSN